MLSSINGAESPGIPTHPESRSISLILSASGKSNPSVISFRVLRLNQKLQDVFYRNVKLLYELQKNFYTIVFILTEGEFLFLKEVLIKMDKVEMCKILKLSNFLVSKLFVRILFKMSI